MTKDRLTQLTCGLVAFKSITGDFVECSRCLDYCIDQFDGYAVHVQRETYDNYPSVLIANTDSPNLDVLILVHTDVVTAPDADFVPSVRDGKIYGRGAFDMKGSVAVGIEVLRHVVETELPLKVGLLIVSDEEIGGFKGSAIWAQKLNPAIVLDPDSGLPLPKIITETKGVLMVKLEARGQKAHGARPWLGIDAIEKLCTVVARLRQGIPYCDKNTPPADRWDATMHVGTINGGGSNNTIADHASATLDFRFPDKADRARLLKLLENLSDDYVSYAIFLEGQAFSIEPDNEAFKAYCETVEKVAGRKPDFERSFGSTDGRFFVDKSTVITHQATGGNHHQENEWVDVTSLAQLLEIQKTFLQSLCGKSLGVEQDGVKQPESCET